MRRKVYAMRRWGKVQYQVEEFRIRLRKEHLSRLLLSEKSTITPSQRSSPGGKLAPPSQPWCVG